jgi:hypothetical protein
LKSGHKPGTSIAKESRVNDIAKVTRKRRRVPDRPKPATDMSWVDRLEPLDADAAAAALERPGERIPPGYYTPETLPPLSEGARKILASVAVGVARLRTKRAAKSAEDGPGAAGITLEDEGQPGIGLSDDGLPGIDPGP